MTLESRTIQLVFYAALCVLGLSAACAERSSTQKDAQPNAAVQQKNTADHAPTKADEEASDEPAESASACPSLKVYGPETAPAEVRLTTPEGERVYRLPRVRATFNDGELSIALPPFGNQLSDEDLEPSSRPSTTNNIFIWSAAPEAKSADTSAGVKANLPALPPGDCLEFPRRLKLEDQKLEIDRYQAPGKAPGKLEARIEVLADQETQATLEVNLDIDELLSISEIRPVSDDTGVRDPHAKGAGLEPFDQGQLSYDPDNEKVSGNLRHDSTFLGFRLDVPQEPGIYVGRPMHGRPMSVIVVEALEGSHLRVLEYKLDEEHYTGEFPEYPTVLLPAEGLSLEELKEKGRLDKRLETHHLVRLPSLAPVDFAKQ